MSLSELTTICVLMALSLIALVCLWLIGAVSYVGLFYPDRVISKEVLAMSGQAMALLKDVGLSLVVGALVQKAAASVSTQPK